MSPTRTIVCAGCSCLCDDVTVNEVADADLIQSGMCALGQAWFGDAATQLQKQNGHYVQGNKCDLKNAIAEAAQLLAAAKAPLICGLNALTIEDARQAWKLADVLKASIDTGILCSHRSGYFSLYKHGKVTATLGEVATRSDVVLFWFCDPQSTHPRHLERYSRPASGPKRQVIVIDQRSTATAELADLFLPLQPQQAPALLLAIRAVISKHDIDWDVAESATGLPQATILQLANFMRSANYGSIILGHVTDDSQFDLASDQLALLVRQLNQETRFVQIVSRDDQNGQGVEDVIASSSGYPFAVNYQRAMPRFFGLEYSAQSILSRGECDAVLLGPSVAEDLKKLPKEARLHLDSIPAIVLASTSHCLNDAQVLIQVAAPGMDGRGDYCRQDNVLLPLKKQQSSERPAAADVFRQLTQHIGDSATV